MSKALLDLVWINWGFQNSENFGRKICQNLDFSLGQFLKNFRSSIAPGAQYLTAFSDEEAECQNVSCA